MVTRYLKLLHQLDRTTFKEWGPIADPEALGLGVCDPAPYPEYSGQGVAVGARLTRPGSNLVQA